MIPFRRVPLPRFGRRSAGYESRTTAAVGRQNRYPFARVRGQIALIRSAADLGPPKPVRATRESAETRVGRFIVFSLDINNLSIFC